MRVRVRVHVAVEQGDRLLYSLCRVLAGLREPNTTMSGTQRTVFYFLKYLYTSCRYLQVTIPFIVYSLISVHFVEAILFYNWRNTEFISKYPSRQLCTSDTRVIKF